MTEVFRADLPHIMHEMIDGEVVVVNLDNGTYYSFDGTGGRIWSLLSGEGRTLPELIAEVTAAHAGERAWIAESIERFVSELRSEKLISSVADSGRIAKSEAQRSDAEPARPFGEPVLNKYTDMESLLLADPIHEVDEQAGWPQVK